MNILLWIFASLGALAAIGVVAFVLLETWADRAQRQGRNPFQ